MTFAVPAGAHFVPRLFAELGVPILSVTVARPSLDDVFMTYTGRTIRDSEAPARTPCAHSPLRREALRWRPATAVAADAAGRGSCHCSGSAPDMHHQDLRAIWWSGSRELMRFCSDRPASSPSLLQPVLFIFVLGHRPGQLVGDRRQQELRTFLFPGVLATSVLFTAVFGRLAGLGPGVRLPPRDDGRADPRGSIIWGKCLGGATVATLQGLVLIALLGTVGVPYSPVLILELIGSLLLALLLTAFGVLLAARIKTIQASMAISQLLIMPLLFLSGALFPLGMPPGWPSSPGSTRSPTRSTPSGAACLPISTSALTRGRSLRRGSRGEAARADLPGTRCRRRVRHRHAHDRGGGVPPRGMRCSEQRNFPVPVPAVLIAKYPRAQTLPTRRHAP